MDAKYLEILVTIVGSALAAGATVWWFLVRRELEPSGELAIDVNFAGRQDSQILVEVIATLSNKSSVRQSYKQELSSQFALLASNRFSDRWIIENRLSARFPKYNRYTSR
jgi:hypothetical protein